MKYSECNVQAAYVYTLAVWEMKIAYIDSQNVHKGIKDTGREIDWKRFFIYAKDKFKVDQLKMFIGYIDTNTEFYRMLQEIGYILIYKATNTYKNNKKVTLIKWNVDSELVLEAVKDVYESNLSGWFLVSWDGDFTVLVEFRKEKNVFSKILVPNVRKASILLKKSAGKNVLNLWGLKAKLSKEQLSKIT